MDLDYTGELDIGELRAEEVAAEYAAGLRQDDLDDAWDDADGSSSVEGDEYYDPGDAWARHEADLHEIFLQEEEDWQREERRQRRHHPQQQQQQGQQ